MRTAWPVQLEEELELPRSYREILRDLVRQHAIRIVPKGAEFELASGEKSRVYCDLKRALLMGSVTRYLGPTLRGDAFVNFGNVTAFAGVPLGGCHLASVAAQPIDPFQDWSDILYVRLEAKAHGIRRLVEGPALDPDARVVLLEDVTTTGGSIRKALQVLRDEGIGVVGILTVVDRRNAWSDPPAPHIDGIPFRAVMRIEELVNAWELE